MNVRQAVVVVVHDHYGQRHDKQQQQQLLSIHVPLLHCSNLFL